MWQVKLAIQAGHTIRANIRWCIWTQSMDTSPCCRIHAACMLAQPESRTLAPLGTVVLLTHHALPTWTKGVSSAGRWAGGDDAG